jgi:hypothetical protein
MSDIESQVKILTRLNRNLSKFLSENIKYSSYSEEDLKAIKDLRKSTSEMREGVQELIQNIQKPHYSSTASNARFASEDMASKVVQAFLNKK